MVDLDETVLGVIQLERQGGMESHLIQYWDTFQVFDYFNATAAKYRWCMLSNPVGSNRIAVIDWWQNGFDSDLHLFITRGIPPGFSPSSVGKGVDTRIPFSKQPACIFHSHLDATSSYGTLIGMVETDLQQDFKVVLGEDGSVLWRTGLVNEDMRLTIRWAERDAAPFEK